MKYAVIKTGGKQYRVAEGDVLDVDRLSSSDKKISFDSILLYAAQKPSFVVDAYTHRILLRHEMIDEQIDYDELQDLFVRHLQRDGSLYNEYHALLVHLGKHFCLKSRPRCRDCPLFGLLPEHSPLRMDD